MMQQPAGHILAQFNVAQLRAPSGDARVAGFEDNIDRINGLAERMPGYVWRFSSDAVIWNDPRMTWTLSLWRSPAALRSFAFSTLHKQFLARRAEWFEPMCDPALVLWWVPEKARPELDEGLDRMARLRRDGDSDAAFGWAHLAAQSGEAA